MRKNRERSCRVIVIWSCWAILFDFVEKNNVEKECRYTDFQNKQQILKTKEITNHPERINTIRPFTNRSGNNWKIWIEKGLGMSISIWSKRLGKIWKNNPTVTLHISYIGEKVENEGEMTKIIELKQSYIFK